MTLVLSPSEIISKLEKIGELGLLGKAPNWSRHLLGELINVQNGAPFSSDKFNREGIGMPLIRIRDIGASETSTYFDGEYDPAYVVRAGDLLVGMDGDFRCARWTSRDALLNQRVCRLKVTSTDLDERFLFLVLQGYLEVIWKETSATTVKHLSSKSIQEIPIPLPSLEEQHKIVELLEDHLSRLNAALAGVKQAKIKAAQFRRSLLQAGMSGFFNNGPRDEVSGLPKTWRIKTLADVADWTSGGTPSSKDSTLYGGNIPWIVIGDLTEGVVLETEKTITKKGLDSSSAKKLPVGAVMVAMYGASIGRTGVMGKEMTTNQAIACGIPKDAVILGQYLLYFLQSQKNEFVAAGKGGAQPNISQGVVKSWQLPLPPIDEQLQIINEIDSQLERLAQANNATEILIRESTAFRRSLLQAAFTGQLTKEVLSV